MATERAVLQTGLVSITFRQLAPREIVDAVAAAGLATIEWGGDVHVPHGDLARGREVRALTASAGLAVSAYGSYYRAGVSEGAGLPFGRVLDTAVALGAPAIRVWAGTVGSAEAGPATWTAVADDLRRVADLAAAGQVGVACEFHGGTLNDTPTASARLLELAAHPNLQTFWQPPHGETAATCAAGLRALLPRVRNLHVFHWWPTPGERLPLQAGAERWRAYLAVLRDSGRTHAVSLEYVPGDALEAFARDAAVLRQWVAGS